MNIFDGHDVKRILNAGANVFNGKFRVVVLNYLCKGETFPDQLKDILHRDSCASNTGLSKMDIGVDHDSFFHFSTSNATNVITIELLARLL